MKHPNHMTVPVPQPWVQGGENVDYSYLHNQRQLPPPALDHDAYIPELSKGVDFIPRLDESDIYRDEQGKLHFFTDPAQSGEIQRDTAKEHTRERTPVQLMPDTFAVHAVQRVGKLYHSKNSGQRYAGTHRST